MKSPKVIYESTDEIEVRIKKHEMALRLLPEGKIKQRGRAEIARWRSLVEIGRWLDNNHADNTGGERSR
jgi:hypothetical protein